MNVFSKGLVILSLTLFLYFQVAGADPVKVEKSNSLTLNGFVRDAKTGETLAGVVVYPKGKFNISAGTNSYGYYSLSLPAGQYEITFQYLGYQTKVATIDMKRDTTVNVELAEKAISLTEVKVTGEKSNHNVISPEVMTKLNVKEIQNIPVFFGEKDILKTIQLLPGISAVGEGNAGFYVRGGGADQNLILLDEAPVYNPSHLLGFFSTFTSEAIKDVTVYKGGFPAEFGGRLSSVVDIKMNEGNNKEFHVSGGIGLISSQLAVEGPLLKHKGSFMITGRRTYADLFLKLLPSKGADSTARKTTLYFYDLNLKANFGLSERDRFYLSCYLGRDNFNLGGSLGLNWGNVTATARWNHIVNNHIFSNTSLIFSRYSYNFKLAVGNASMNVLSEVKDWNLKEDFIYNLNSNNQIKFGFNSIYHVVVPGVISSNYLTSATTLNNKYAWENALYISHEYKFSNSIILNYGIRGSAFSVLGPGQFYEYSSGGLIIDSLKYSGKFVKTYFNIEPRFMVNKQLSENTSIKGAYNRNIQNMHLLSNSTSGNPTDLWIPSSNNVKPEIADQFSIGYYHNIKNNHYQFSTETYYKILQNQIDYRDGNTRYCRQTCSKSG